MKREDQVNVRKGRLLLWSRWERPRRNILPKLPRRMLCWQRTNAARANDVCVVVTQAWCLWGQMILSILHLQRNVTHIYTATHQSRSYHHSSTVMSFNVRATPSKPEHINLTILMRVRQAQDMHTHITIFFSVAAFLVRFIARAVL